MHFRVVGFLCSFVRSFVGEWTSRSLCILLFYNWVCGTTRSVWVGEVGRKRRKFIFRHSLTVLV